MTLTVKNLDRTKTQDYVENLSGKGHPISCTSKSLSSLLLFNPIYRVSILTTALSNIYCFTLHFNCHHFKACKTLYQHDVGSITLQLVAAAGYNTLIIVLYLMSETVHYSSLLLQHAMHYTNTTSEALPYYTNMVFHLMSEALPHR